MTVKVPAFLPTSRVERTVVLLLTLAFLLLVTVVVASSFSVVQARKFNDAVLRAQNVRALAQNVLTDTVNAETGERGYVITGEAAYLGDYNRAMDSLTSRMNALQAAVAADPAQQRRVATLRIHIDAKAVALKRSVAYVDAKRAAEAIAVMRQGAGFEQMQRIRDLVHEVDHAEAAVLDKRRRQAYDADQLTLAVNIASALLIVLVGVVTIALVRRYVGELRASRAALDEVNQGLEQTVEERTRELVEANENIRIARDRAETLLREVNHRIGNSLQLASSFIAMQSRALKNDEAKAALRGAQARLEAVAHIHRSLYTSDDVTVVELDEYLAGLVEALQGSLAPYEGGLKLSFEAEPLIAPTDRAVSLGVILAELVTNSVKYAYASDSGGEIRVKLLSPGDKRGVLIVEDDGQGMSEKATPKGTGLGRKIIDAMATNLSGVMVYDRKHKGVRATLEFKL